MKIVYCIPATYNSGGMERVLAVKANSLTERGHQIIIVTTDQAGRAPYFPMHEHIQHFDLGVNYEENNGAPIWDKILNYPRKQRRHRKELTALLLSLRADIVISMFGNDASFLPQIQDGSKKILEYHFSKLKRLQYGRTGLWKLADEWRTKQDEKVVRHFDRFVVLTHEDQELWGELPNISVIPNPRPFESDRVSSLEEKIVIAAGRYESQKNFAELIRIWSKVAPQYPDWTLKIFGNGSERGDLEALVRELGLISVRLEHPTQQMTEEYLQSSVYVLTSRYEGLPMVLIEAQTMGLPIVSYACLCGPRDLITSDKDGFLIPYADRDTFAEKLSLLMQDASLRQQMGKQARLASRRFDPELILSQWEQLFAEVTGKSPDSNPA